MVDHLQSQIPTHFLSQILIPSQNQTRCPNPIPIRTHFQIHFHYQVRCWYWFCGVQYECRPRHRCCHHRRHQPPDPLRYKLHQFRLALVACRLTPLEIEVQSEGGF